MKCNFIWWNRKWIKTLILICMLLTFHCVCITQESFKRETRMQKKHENEFWIRLSIESMRMHHIYRVSNQRLGEKFFDLEMNDIFVIVIWLPCLNWALNETVFPWCVISITTSASGLSVVLETLWNVNAKKKMLSKITYSIWCGMK